MDCKNPKVFRYDLVRSKDGVLKYGWQFVGYYKTLKGQGYDLPELNYLVDRPVSGLVVTHRMLYGDKGNNDIGRIMLLPCRNCMPCRIARSREWAIRCVLESRAFDKNCFITLTYDPVFMPKDMSLHKEDFQRFMKRLRKNTGLKIRYYMCGEYGELHGRPHFHACLFGYNPDDLYVWSVRNGVRLYRSPFLEKCWPFGFVTVGEVTYESAAYVARYVTKKITGDEAEQHYNGRLPEYNNMSLKPGIGTSYFEKYGEEMYAREFVVIRGNIKCKIPRYFDNIYDRYYGNHAFEDLIKPHRDSSVFKKFTSNVNEFTVKRMIQRADSQEEKAKNKKRNLEEVLL